MSRLARFWDVKLNLTDRFLAAYNQPQAVANLVYIRAFVGIFFCWKLLSRNFEMFGTIPPEVFYYYPYKIYPLYTLVTGLPGLMELVTFHWIHWITGFPGVETLHAVKMTAVASCAALALFGRGPYRIFAVSAFVLITYLWGFVYLMGQDEDAVFLYTGSLLCLLFAGHEDPPLWRLRERHFARTDLEAGRSFGCVLLIFIIYYFASGVNKLSDISFVGWFQFHMIEGIEYMRRAGELGDVTRPPAFSRWLEGHYWLNYTTVPLVYLSHLAIPLLFFKRHLVYEFAVFYFLFHLLAMAVCIAFTGYLFVWLLLFDIAFIGRWLMKRGRV